jgi:sugar phosphate isomerase/epimerase
VLAVRKARALEASSGAAPGTLLELRPDALLEADLGDLLRQLVEAFTGRARVRATLSVEGQGAVPAEVQVAFYRIAQEALNNVAKHAQAQTAAVALRQRPDRVERLVEVVRAVAETTLAAGVRSAFHSHVGSWVETEAETRRVLDAVDGRRLGFCPDTGHLAWADADVARLIADYAPRVAAVHVKDCRLSVARRARAERLTYQQTVMAGLWAEPGRGELELTEMLARLPADFAGWLIVEVDRPDIPDAFESARASAAWMARLAE